MPIASSDCATIEFVPKSAELIISEDGKRRFFRWIRLRVRLVHKTDFRLGPDHSLAEADLTVNVFDSVSPQVLPLNEGTIGLFVHLTDEWGNTESCGMEVFPADWIFADLHRALEAGRLPSSVTLQAKGLRSAYSEDDEQTVVTWVDPAVHPEVLSFGINLPFTQNA